MYKYMYRRIKCLIFGHDWFYYSGSCWPDTSWEYKKCERCGEKNVDRIFEN